MKKLVPNIQIKYYAYSSLVEPSHNLFKKLGVSITCTAQKIQYVKSFDTYPECMKYAQKILDEFTDHYDEIKIEVINELE